MLAWLGAVVSAGAHPISMSNAMANVREDEVLVELRIMLEDLVMFHNLKANAETIFKADDLRQAAEKHEAFLLKYFTVRDAEGQLLEGKIEERNVTAIPDDGVPQVELMKRQAIYLMRFVPAEKKPKFLTFIQQFGGAKSVIPSIMDFMVLQNGVWTAKPVQLGAGRPHSVELDWENPPDEAPQSWRKLREKQEAAIQKRLGITSYSGLYSYIYLTDQEARHEILVPLLTFEKWLPLERADAEFITVAEQEAAREKIGEWFRDHNPVEIDGIPVKPVLQRLQFFGLDINDFAQNAKPRRISAYQARLGIILGYPAKAPPNRVRMTWETFHESAPFLRSVIYDRDLNPTEEFFVKDKPRFEWTREGNPPVPHSFLTRLVIRPPGISKITLALFVAAPVFGLLLRFKTGRTGWSLLGSGVLLIAGVCFWNHPSQISFSQPRKINDPVVTRHASTLLQNIYRAWDYQNESDVYDALEHSVKGDLLEELFLKTQAGLRMQEQGGAVARVKKVTIEKIGVVGSEAAGTEIAIDCTWRVRGTVEHWGHIHTRENKYTARMKIDATMEGRGRIVGFEVTDQKPVDFGTSLRRFEDSYEVNNKASPKDK
jgi:hypothetical protein